MTTPTTAVQRLVPIVSHYETAPNHHRIKFHDPEIASQAKAGQFVHVLPRGETSSDPLLRRAFSFLSVTCDTFEILYRVEGRGTAQMASWRVGDCANVIGPLGVGFAALPSPPRRAILVGGGVGVPPMAMLASTRQQDQSILALIGSRSALDVLCQDDFAQYDVTVRVATDDGSTGHHGFVTDLLSEELRLNSEATVYACGPLPMLRAVSALCDKFQVDCQVSLEENMPCGIGVCNGCVIGVHGAGDDYGRYRRICVEGPVSWANEIDWGRAEEGGCP